MIYPTMTYFERAKKLNETCGEELHFRGNFGSFSLISLNRETPEEGIPNLQSFDDGTKSLENIAEVLREKKTKKGKKCSRDTPEKELQAWIIKSAISNSMYLPFNQAGKIRFVTSELVLPLDEEECKLVNANLRLQGNKAFSQRDIRNDILGIDEDGSIVVIELKSERALIEICNQVNIFSYLLSLPRHNDAISQVVELLTGQQWNNQVRKMIVWPYAKKPSKNTLETLIKSENQIIAIGYKALKGSDGGAPAYVDGDRVGFELEQG